ncbi:MAG: Sec-independent protein translocase protein TatB [Sphingobium sp.]|jgi:sec-independent protein translocase protein TatB|nr:twin-arginine translocase subunit TatB [Sphingobium sp.]MCP5397998.1 twin-arginine translocase subunit TatB [Sphingomonas sp.]
MFDIAPTELLLVAIVAVVVIGPKDLPRAMYKVGQVIGKARAMSRHFRSGVDAMMREVEMEEMEKKWAAENKRIMEQYPGAEAEPDTAPMEALPPPAQQEGPKEAKAVETNTQPGLPFGDEPTGGKSA